MKIGIIGTGITGNAAGWLLHKDHDVTLYEQSDYAGGHANTVMMNHGVPVDTGFIVYNEWTYPNLIALFDHLGVKTVPADMSFAVSRDHGRLEYAGHALFAQRRNMISPRFYMMMRDIMRFYKNAPSLLANQQTALTLGDYLTRERYSDAFINDHILPMAAAIWSTGTVDARLFPAESFVRFFVNHGLFLFKGRPQWRTVDGGSRAYVEKLTAPFKERIRTKCRIVDIRRDDNQVRVTDFQGHTDVFDHVIMACHADQSLALLSDANAAERAVLGAFPYGENTAYLHRDAALMPRRKAAWASWNYLSSADSGQVCVTYWMNRLQSFLPVDDDVFVTLNPASPPAPEKVMRKITYHHPQYTPQALEGWARINEIQGKSRVWFCGAWCGYGFHEDGLSAGLAVAERLGGVRRPWQITEKSPAGTHATG